MSGFMYQTIPGRRRGGAFIQSKVMAKGPSNRGSEAETMLPQAARAAPSHRVVPLGAAKQNAPVSLAGAKAYESIRRAIIEGQFASGERLKENVLTTLCNVSRTPVREALRRLATEGLVIVTPNAGAHVSILEPSELEETYVLRGMLESYAAQQAATRISQEAIAQMKILAAAMEKAVEEGQASINRDFADANAQFHRIIMSAAHSHRLAAMAAMVVDLSFTLRTFALYTPEDRFRSLHHHRELIEAFEARDGVWAASVMKSHMQAAYQALVRSRGK